MSTPIIRIDKLGKSYTIGRQQQNRRVGQTFGETLAGALKRPFSRSAAGRGANKEEFWALRDISFDVEQGEVIGVIGRNGAGKSTLFKILSRITDPSEGRAQLRGRVASLLEVGTGFHPELTGRENIYLNGAILGMTRAEIRKNFDEIVAFSEVEKFLDTPVKRYSSGMYVRLAFSVAAHLEPEILIVDEVLAVGDSAFQQKCLGKMRGIAQTDGRTVLFVSHNMSSIRQLCQRVCLLEKGRVSLIGPPDEAIGKYLSDAIVGRKVSVADWEDRETTGEARILQVELQPGESSETAQVKMGDDLRIRMEIDVRDPLVDPSFGVFVYDASGTPMLDLRSLHDHMSVGQVSGKITVQLEVKQIGLYPGHYFLTPWISDTACVRHIDFPRMCCAFDISSSPRDVDLQLDRDWGSYFVRSAWSVVGATPRP